MTFKYVSLMRTIIVAPGLMMVRLGSLWSVWVDKGESSEWLDWLHNNVLRYIYLFQSLNSLLDYKILDFLKLKAYIDKKLNCYWPK